MKKIYSFILTTLISFGLYAQKTEIREIGGFTAISVSGIANVFLSKGAYKVEIKRKKDNLNKVKTILNENTLIVNSGSDDIDIFIKSPNIQKISASGASKITSQNSIEEENLYLYLSGASDINLNLKVKELNTKINGAGKLTLTGEAMKHNLMLSGAGNVNAEKLITEDMHAVVSGVGNAKVNVTNELKSSISGVGNLTNIADTIGKDINGNENYEIESDVLGDIDVTENGDTTRIKLGKKKILIIDGVEKTKINLNLKDTTTAKKEDEWKYKINGFMLGVNGFLNDNNSLSVPQGYEFLETDIAQSTNVQIHFFDPKVNLFKKHISLHTGLGLEFNSYEFRKDYWIQQSSSENDRITANRALQSDSSEINFTKNRLKDTYLNVPLLFAFHTHKNHKKSFHLAIGGYAGVRLASKVKYKYRADGEGTKLKIKDDYYLSPFRYGLMTSIGYSNINLFANYALNGLFENGKGPELHPFSIGVVLVGF